MKQVIQSSSKIFKKLKEIIKSGVTKFQVLLLLYAMERVGWERLDVVGATRVLERGSSTWGMDSVHMQ